jgi:hypothetical protein
MFKFFCLTFIVPQSMIEKISVPMDSCDLRSDAFEGREPGLRGLRRLECQPACADGRASRVGFLNTTSEYRDNNGRFRTTPARYPLDKADLQPGLRSKL